MYKCANERIPRRHALATSHWQRYVSDQNTVAKYRPCSSTFYGNCSFCTLPNVLEQPEFFKTSHFIFLHTGRKQPFAHGYTQEVLGIKIFRIKIVKKSVPFLLLQEKGFCFRVTSLSQELLVMYKLTVL